MWLEKFGGKNSGSVLSGRSPAIVPDVPESHSSSMSSVPADTEVCVLLSVVFLGLEFHYPVTSESVGTFIFWVRTNYQPTAHSS